MELLGILSMIVGIPSMIMLQEKERPEHPILEYSD